MEIRPLISTKLEMKTFRCKAAQQIGQRRFWLIVELLSALFAVLIAIKVSIFLPFLLAFSAGAMMVVVAGELLPEAAMGHKQECVRGFLFGFLLMMALDVALG